jgi:hypothetical protein
MTSLGSYTDEKLYKTEGFVNSTDSGRLVREMNEDHIQHG